MKEEGTTGTTGTQRTTEWPPGRAERGGRAQHRAQHFFVTGLPRSRTSWLANWFTWEQSLCFHDGLHGCDSVTALKQKMDKSWRALVRAHPDKDVFVGNSDSALLLVWPRVLKLFPDAKWVIVLRDTDAAARSFVRFFTAHPYIGQPKPDLADTVELFEHTRKQVRLLASALPEGQVRCTELYDLDFQTEIEGLWHYVFDGAIKFPTNRWALAKDLMINPMSPKIKMNVEAWNTLLAVSEPVAEREPA